MAARGNFFSSDLGTGLHHRERVLCNGSGVWRCWRICCSTAGEAVLARLGMVAYLFGAVVVVVAETAYVGKRDWIYPQIVLYVVLAFLAQAAFGASLLQTGLVAGWAAWASIIWNLGWLLIMFIVRPRDIYFPVLHHVAPLVIGIALLTQG